MKKTHGLSNTRTYRIWVQMRRRCRDPKHSSYANYGGRGINVCDRWNDSFEDFFADMGECPAGMSIEREKNDRGYEPINCHWATIEEQNNNRRTVTLIEHGGKRLSLKQWSRELGITYTTLVSRKRKGLTGAELLAPLKKQVPVEVNGQVMSLRQAAAAAGLKYATVYRRVRTGLSIEQAINPQSLKNGEAL